MKSKGLTLLELIIASAIAGIIFTVGFAMVNHLSLQQTKVEMAQRFYQEGRVIMDRISIFARNQTIDYDRYWTLSVEAGCLADRKSYANFIGVDDDQIQYADMFYIDAQSFEPNTLDTFRGGVDALGLVSGCTQAIDGPQTELYLINSQRTQRTTVSFDAGNNTVEIQREIGADTTNDGFIDLWSDSPIFDTVDNLCKIDDGASNLKIVKGESSSESFCRLAHPPTNITPNFVEIQNLVFLLSPSRDPYLAYEIEDNRIQPHVLVKMDMQFRDAIERGYTLETTPQLNLQTSNTSRVYGNTRPQNNIYRLCSTPRCE